MKYLRAMMRALRLWWQRRICLRRRAPNLLFPVRNEVTGNTIWYELNITAYGLFVTIHRAKPRIKSIEDLSPQTAMAGVHIDYFVDNEDEIEMREQVKVQLYDEIVGAYGDEPHWEIPNEYSSPPTAQRDVYLQATLLWTALCSIYGDSSSASTTSLAANRLTEIAYVAAMYHIACLLQLCPTGCRRSRFKEESILLVHDVQSWQPNELRRDTSSASV